MQIAVPHSVWILWIYSWRVCFITIAVPRLVSHLFVFVELLFAIYILYQEFCSSISLNFDSASFLSVILTILMSCSLQYSNQSCLFRLLFILCTLWVIIFRLFVSGLLLFLLIFSLFSIISKRYSKIVLEVQIGLVSSQVFVVFQSVLWAYWLLV